MKHASILLLAFSILVVPFPGHAQSPSSEIDSLLVGIWPDYDRPSALILLTGTLGPGATLPATVSLPLPAGATVNAVARIDQSDRMTDDIAYHTGGGQLVLTTPDPRFRVEYYLPYQLEGGERSFEFTWLAEVAVERLKVQVQRPAGADSLSTVPKATEVARAPDGLVYHSLPEQRVPAGRAYPVRVRYAMPEARLTAPRRDEAGGAKTTRAAPAAESSGSTPGAGLDWPNLLIALVALAMVGVFVWQVAKNRPASGPKRDAAAEEGHANLFCTACGKPLASEDRFCRHCGAPSKGS